MAGESFFNILGLARRAGKLIHGHDAVLRNFERGRLLIISLDYSRRESSYFRRLAVKKGIPVLFVGSKEEFGKLLGTSPTGVLLVVDRNFARKLLEEFNRE